MAQGRTEAVEQGVEHSMRDFNVKSATWREAVASNPALSTTGQWKRAFNGNMFPSALESIRLLL
jgi:hypothetical protein